MRSLEASAQKKVRKGIIFAADTRGETHPMTQVVAQALIPVYDKPMIYYPLSTLILSGIREILIVSAPQHLRSFMELLGNGSRLGISISYAEQRPGRGIAASFLTAERFLGGESVCLIPGDSIFYGNVSFLGNALKFEGGAMIFACHRKDRDRPSGCVERRGYAAVEFDRNGKAVRLEENLRNTRSTYVVTGLYVYDNKVVEIVKGLESSHSRTGTMLKSKPPKDASVQTGPRCLTSGSDGGMRIGDVNRQYLLRGELEVRKIGTDIGWLDAGTEAGILEASTLIANIERRERAKTGCIEEAALHMGFINAERLERLTRDLPEGTYREYLVRLLRTLPRQPHKPGKGFDLHRPFEALTPAK